LTGRPLVSVFCTRDPKDLSRAWLTLDDEDTCICGGGRFVRLYEDVERRCED
jgi:hypothetical protein